jgi:hypothetical protein
LLYNKQGVLMPRGSGLLVGRHPAEVGEVFPVKTVGSRECLPVGPVFPWLRSDKS